MSTAVSSPTSNRPTVCRQEGNHCSFLENSLASASEYYKNRAGDIGEAMEVFFALVNSDWTSHSCTLTMSNLLMARFWLVWTEQPTNQNPPNCQNIILQLIWHDI